jgi:hypothetical protein
VLRLQEGKHLLNQGAVERIEILYQQIAVPLTTPDPLNRSAQMPTFAFKILQGRLDLSPIGSITTGYGRNPLKERCKLAHRFRCFVIPTSSLNDASRHQAFDEQLTLGER